MARLPRVTLLVARRGERGRRGGGLDRAPPAIPSSRRCAGRAERGRPGLAIDPDIPYPERHQDPVPDPHAVLEIGAAAYLGPLVEAVAGGEPGEADRRREAGMAYHLRRALEDVRGTASEDASIVALVGAAHVRRLAAALDRPAAAPRPPPARRRSSCATSTRGA